MLAYKADVHYEDLGFFSTFLGIAIAVSDNSRVAAMVIAIKAGLFMINCDILTIKSGSHKIACKFSIY